MRDLNRAIGRDPERGPYLLRGLAHEALGADAKASEDYSQVIRREPAHALAHECRGDCKRRLGNVMGARIDYARAVALHEAAGMPDRAQRVSKKLAALG